MHRRRLSPTGCWRPRGGSVRPVGKAVRDGRGARYSWRRSCRPRPGFGRARGWRCPSILQGSPGLVKSWSCTSCVFIAISLRRFPPLLLYIAGPEEVKASRMPLWADDPGLLVSELEESAEGCRWLLERWAEYRNLLDRKSNWNTPVLLRFIRLQGKNVVESIYDPALNSIFLAWDVLVQKYAKEEWESFREERPTTDPAYNHRLHWREIAPRPSDPAKAWKVLYAI